MDSISLVPQDTIKTILTRRSVRSYLPAQITDTQLATILRCGLYAPAGGGLQMPRFLVIQDAALMDRLNIAIQRSLAARDIVEGQMMNRGILRARRPNYHFCHHAPTLVSAVAPRIYDNAMADCACALENMQLAAHALGLGACWSNQTHWLTDEPSIREILSALGLREEEDVFGSIGVGYPSASGQMAAERRADRIALDHRRELPEIAV